MLGMLRKRIEDTFAAEAFAEVAEIDTAMCLAGVETKARTSFADSFAAVAFAEVGCHGEAREIMGYSPQRCAPPRTVIGFLDSVGLSGAHVAYGLAEA